MLNLALKRTLEGELTKYGYNTLFHLKACYYPLLVSNANDTKIQYSVKKYCDWLRYYEGTSEREYSYWEIA